MQIFEYEVWTSDHDGLHGGQPVTEIRKVLVAAIDDWEGYRTALAMCWRGDNQITKVWWVP